MVNQQRNKDLIKLLIGFAAIVVFNLLSQVAFTRIDFTKEKRYTISPISVQILNDLKEPVKITVFLEGEFPSGFKRLRNATKDLLNDYKQTLKSIKF